MQWKQLWRGVGAGLAAFVSGLMIYERPPADLSEFAMWAWLPGLQAISVTLAAWGINVATRTPKP